MFRGLRRGVGWGEDSSAGLDGGDLRCDPFPRHGPFVDHPLRDRSSYLLPLDLLRWQESETGGFLGVSSLPSREVFTLSSSYLRWDTDG